MNTSVNRPSERENKGAQRVSRHKTNEDSNGAREGLIIAYAMCVMLQTGRLAALV